ncbi:MAG: hypothetical protein ACK4YP_23025, partial [Myxococcota bacterium]
MPQLSLRLVPFSEAPPGPAGQGPAVPSAVPRSPRAATIERLRALVGSRGRVGILPPPPERDTEAPALDPGSVSTGIAGLDAWLRGWPRPGPVEIAGLPGAGRLALLTPLFERLTREGRTVLLVDPLQQVHPPGLGRIDASRLVLVRPSPERAAWTAEQVARSGAVDVLVVLDAPPLGRGGVRLTRAAEAGNLGVFVLSERPEVELPAVLRLEMGGWRQDRVLVRCTRSRDGRRVGERAIAPAERPVET